MTHAQPGPRYLSIHARHNLSLRQPRHPLHHSRLRVQNQRHPAVLEQVLRYPGGSLLNHNDVRLVAHDLGDNVLEVLVLLEDERLEGDELALAALVHERRAEEEDLRVGQPDRHGAVGHVLGADDAVEEARLGTRTSGDLMAQIQINESWDLNSKLYRSNLVD